MIEKSTKLILLVGLLIIGSFAIVGTNALSDQSDAVSHGTADNPLTSLTANLSEMYADSDKTYYVASGSSISLTGKTTYPSYKAVSTTGGTGITVDSSSGTASGTMPSSDVNVICMYKPNSTATGTVFTIKLASASGGPYEITTSVTPSTGGTITPSSASVEAGGSQKFVISAASGSYIYQVYIDGNTITPSGTYPTQYEYTFTNVNETHQIGAAFYAKPTYTVTINAGTGGSVNHSSITNVPYGSTISVSSNKVTINGTTVTATPDTGYSFSSWTNTSGTITSNKTITANFTVKTYTVTINAGTGGSVNHSSITNVPYGSSITVSSNKVTINGTTVTATASTGYSFGSWTNASGTITSNRTITANFTANTYTVTINAGTGGSVSPTSITNVPYGTQITVSDNTLTINGTTVTATPDTGYSFGSWTNASGTITSNRTITANFTTNTYTVTISAGTGGSVSPTSITSVPYGTQITVSGNTLSINGTTVTATPDVDYLFSSWTNATEPIVADRTITANFTSTSLDHGTPENPLSSLTASLSAMYADPDKTYYVAPGASINLIGKMTYPQYYGVITQGGSGLSIDSNTGDVTGIMPDTDVDIYCSYHRNSSAMGESWTIKLATASGGPYEITTSVTPSTAGTITPSSASVEAGGSQTFIINAISSSYIYEVYVDGNTIIPPGAFPTQYEYTFTNVNETHHIGAAFYAKPTYTVTINAGTGGSVSPTSITNVPYGTQITVSDNTLTINGTTVTATASTGYYFGSWTNATDPIVGDRTITANFTTNTYTVTINAGTGGSVSPTSITNVPYGTQITVSGNTLSINGTTVTATPDTGYSFGSWTNASGTITSNRTITANFTTNTYTVTISAGTGGSVSPTRIINVPSGSQITVSGNTLSINGTTVTATPDEDYIFSSWTNATDPIVADRTITANFEERPVIDVWWSNDYANGSVEIVFDFSGLDNSSTHTLSIPLWKYNGRETSLQDDPHGLLQFDETPYTIQIENGYNSNIRVSVLSGNNVVKGPISYSVGNWQQYALEIDAQSGIITFKGIHNILDRITQPFSFVNYTVTYTAVAADLSDVVNGMAIEKIYHGDNGGTVNPHFQVSKTTTYLNTFGFIMNDPEINIIEKFPNYNDLRLNFYSFAYYGDTVTINGHTMNVENGDIILYYIPKNTPIYDPQHTHIVSYTTENIITTASDENAKELRTPLMNIYVTWTNIKSETETDRVCTLTFVDSKMTINMGNFQPNDLTVSFTGTWYFTTFLYEPYTAMESTYEMDWWDFSNVDRNGFILIFDLIIIIGYIVANKIYVPGLMDKAVVIGGLVLSMVLLTV